MRILLAYDSLSGNTKMVADEIEEILQSEGHEVVSFRVSPLAEYPLDEDFDLYVLGAWTVDYGRTPPDMKDFIAELAVKPENVAILVLGKHNGVWSFIAELLTEWQNTSAQATRL